MQAKTFNVLKALASAAIESGAVNPEMVSTDGCAAVGDTRTLGGVVYQKDANGVWYPVGDGSGTEANLLSALSINRCSKQAGIHIGTRNVK